MCKLICVTNRHLCREDFLQRVERIAAARPDAILLREKDLPEAEYTALAEKVAAVCRKYDVDCMLHTHPGAAVSLGIRTLHLPLPVLRTVPDTVHRQIALIGASCHSREEAQEAVSLGACYLIAGHIFETDCKRGLPGRGLDFLREICDSRGVPVYAIGGITPERVPEVLHAGAAGICVMSRLMQCDAPAEEIEKFRRACHEA
ncbi:MAG: thiamine phosphate synthase [Oscillospiraceae bacterium]|nr:thiamine phosphate synthase [Oscillospiraceae bacterium]